MLSGASRILGDHARFHCVGRKIDLCKTGFEKQFAYCLRMNDFSVHGPHPRITITKLDMPTFVLV